MHFRTKSYLKSNRDHTAKYSLKIQGPKVKNKKHQRPKSSFSRPINSKKRKKVIVLYLIVKYDPCCFIFLIDKSIFNSATLSINLMLEQFLYHKYKVNRNKL